MSQLTIRTKPTLSSALNLLHTLRFFPPSRDALSADGPRPYHYFRNAELVAFDPAAQGYSDKNAWILSDLTFLVYSSQKTALATEALLKPVLARVFKPDSLEVKVFHGEPPIGHSEWIDDTIQCVVAHDATKGVVAFRGTLPKSFGNWLTDAQIELVQESGASSATLKVHRGFKEAVDCVWPRLIEYLAGVSRGPNFRWWFAGHSLGAALATVAVRRFGKAHALYTFGAPRVGNREFAQAVVDSVEGRCYRIVNHDDLVTRLPHQDHAEWEHPNGEVRTYEDQYDDPSPFERALLGLRAALRYLPLVDPATRAFVKVALHLEGDVLDKAPLRQLVDHAPVFYSKILWNELATKSSSP